MYSETSIGTEERSSIKNDLAKMDDLITENKIIADSLVRNLIGGQDDLLPVNKAEGDKCMRDTIKRLYSDLSLTNQILKLLQNEMWG